jgi:hypothetical protein
MASELTRRENKEGIVHVSEGKFESTVQNGLDSVSKSSPANALDRSLAILLFECTTNKSILIRIKVTNDSLQMKLVSCPSGAIFCRIYVRLRFQQWAPRNKCGVESLRHEESERSWASLRGLRPVPWRLCNIQ